MERTAEGQGGNRTAEGQGGVRTSGNPADYSPQVAATFSEDGAVASHGYVGMEKLTTEQFGNLFAVLLGDMLGPDPSPMDLIAIQRSIMGALAPA